MDLFETFVRAGMNKKRASVYAALLDKGMQSISQLSRETHISRPALYELLPHMEHSGLVAKVIKQKRALYKAESPQRVLDIYTQEQQSVSQQLAQIAAEHQTESHDKPIIKYFEGKRALTFVFDDVIRTLPRGGVFYRYSSRTKEVDGAAQTYYAKNRDAKGIERMAIVSETKALSKANKLERSIKSIPRSFDLFEDDISLVIYGDKTAYIDYTSKTSFIVESQKIARFQEKLFRLLFKKL